MTWGNSIKNASFAMSIFLYFGVAICMASQNSQNITSEDVWRNISDLDVTLGSQDYYQTPYCKKMIKDVRENPAFFKRITPEIEGDDLINQKDKAHISTCTAKEIEFAQERSPHGGIIEGLYYGDNFAVWKPETLKKRSVKRDIVLWQGPSYTLHGDDNEYVASKERLNYDRQYDDMGELRRVSSQECSLKGVRGSLTEYEDVAYYVRNFFVVEYRETLFYADVSVPGFQDEYISFKPVLGKSDREKRTKVFRSTVAQLLMDKVKGGGNA